MKDKNGTELQPKDWVRFHLQTERAKTLTWFRGFVIKGDDEGLLVCDGDPRVENWAESGYGRAAWVRPFQVEKTRAVAWGSGIEDRLSSGLSRCLRTL